MKFLKMHGLGNDFVIFDARSESLSLTQNDMVEISDRRRGVGCDLITVIEQSDNADAFVQFFNADGSESGACGNATRCVADLLMNEYAKTECTLEVISGEILKCISKGDLLVEVDMGKPNEVVDLDISYGGVANPVFVDVGNPHCVFFVDNYEDISLEELGPYFENHNIFPNRANVEFVIVRGEGDLRQKTWERGVGLTDACGSGACAVGIAAFHRGLSSRSSAVELDGGVLNVEIREEDGHVLMTGPVAYVFDGEL